MKSKALMVAVLAQLVAGSPTWGTSGKPDADAHPYGHLEWIKNGPIELRLFLHSIATLPSTFLLRTFPGVRSLKGKSVDANQTKEVRK